MRLTLEQRRIAFVALLAVAGLAFAAALVATLSSAASAGTWLIASAVVLVLALAGEIFLLVWGEGDGFDRKGEWYAWESEGRRSEELLLRCSSCEETFPVRDTGERPLRHACPHCGATGVLRDRSAPARA